MFLEGDVRRARYRTAMGFSRVDSFFPTWQPMPTEDYKLGWVTGLYTLFFDEVAPPDGPDLLMASGRSAGATYRRDSTILCANWDAEDLLDHKRDQSLEQKAGYQVATVPGRNDFYTFGGTMFGPGHRQRVHTAPAFLIADVRAQNLRPIGTDAAEEGCVGFRDPDRNVYVFRRLTADQKLRVAIDALGQISGDNISHRQVDEGIYRTDTGQITRDVGAGLIMVDSTTLHAIAGNLGNSLKAHTSGLSVSTATETGAVIWASFDRRPPSDSQHWVLKMVTVATNTGQNVRLHHSNTDGNIYAVDQMGSIPISTTAEATSRPTVVSVGEREVLRIYLKNGSWELLYEGGQYYLACDTEGVQVELPTLGPAVSCAVIPPEGQAEQVERQPFTYPGAFDLLLVRRG
jgi:hypothetical protein